MERNIEKTNYSIILYTIIIDLYMISFFNTIMGVPSIPINIRQWLAYIMVFCALWECFRNIVVANGKMSKVIVWAIFYLAYTIIGCLFKGLDAQTILSYIFFPISFILFFENSKNTYYTTINLVQNIQFILFCYFAVLFFIQQIVLGGTARDKINSVYYIITLLPIVINSKNKLIHLISFLIATSLSVLTLKLGACLCVVAVFVYYYFKTNKKRTILQVFKYIIIALVLFLIINNIAKSFFDFNIFDKLQASINDGGSGRFELWGETGKMISKKGLTEMIFGSFYATSKDSVSGSSAHNDFLEALWRLGIFGFMILVSYVYNVFKTHKISRTQGYIQNLEPLIVLLIMMTISQLLFIPAYVGFLGMGIGIYAAQSINKIDV